MKRAAVVLVVLLGVLAQPMPANAAATVCAVFCDTRDPSQARQDTFPVADRTQNGRRISLHLSDADAMAWGSIDNGATGDAIWLDRTWDGGATWDGLLDAQRADDRAAPGQPRHGLGDHRGRRGRR